MSNRRKLAGEDDVSIPEPQNTDDKLDKERKDSERRERFRRTVRTAIRVFTQASGFWGIISTIIGKLVAAGGIGVVSATLTSYFSTVVFLLQSYGGTALLVAVGVLLGVTAFMFKIVVRFWYGLVEVVVGSSAIYFYTPVSVSLQAIGIGPVLQTAGGLYIIVRGVENMYEGMRSTNPIKIFITTLKRVK
jgi:hypothetical protein